MDPPQPPYTSATRFFNGQNGIGGFDGAKICSMELCLRLARVPEFDHGLPYRRLCGHHPVR